MSAGNSAQTPGGAIQVFGNLMEIMFNVGLADVHLIVMLFD